MNKDFFYIPKKDSSLTKKTSLVKERINLISSHMFKQYSEYVQSSQNTGVIFKQLLSFLPEVVEALKESFAQKGINNSNISFEVDADKSVGILNILWHSMSFTICGSSKPQALYRKEESPLFSGRIVALNGDFKNASINIMDLDYSGLLSCEVASLFVPADSTKDAVIKIRHLGNIEHTINQSDAAKEFLLKIVEIICGGGFYHEENFES